MNSINKIVHTDAFKYAIFAFLIAMVAFFAVLPLMSNMNPEVNGPSLAALLVTADDGGGEGGGEGGGGEGGGGGGGGSPTPVPPTATLTVNGSHNVSVPVGTALNYAWNSTNGTAWSSTWSSSGGACGSGGSWDANTAQGAYTWPADISQVNCTYTIIYKVTNSDGIAQDTIYVTINPAPAAAPTCTLDASPVNIYSGDPSTLTWSTSNATNVSINQGIGSVNASGYKSVTPSNTTTYTLTATGAGGTVNCTKTITVTPSAPGATCTITANPNPCTLDAASGLCTAKITWSTQHMSNPAVFVDKPYEQIFQGAPSGSTDAPWISGTPIKFYIKENTQFSPPPPIVCSVTVVGVPGPTYACIGNIPANASPWDSEESTGLTVNTPWVHGDPDSAPKCQYHCNAGYIWNGSSCVPPAPVDPICSLTFNGLTNATNVDPLQSRVWAWSSAYGSTYSMSAVVSNCEDPSQNGSFNPWQPWVGATGDITGGSNTGIPGANKYGCKGTNTYVVSNSVGKSVTCVASVSFKNSPTTPAPTCTLNANPTSISQGQSSTLSWTTTNATNVTIDQGVGGVNANGSQSVSPSATKTYTLTATGAGGTVTCTKTVTVIPPTPTAPTCTLNANPTSINQGQSSTLSWSTTNATNVTLNQSVVATQGSQSVSPSNTTTYTLTATGPGGSVTCTKIVTVTPVVNAPTCTLNANPSTINKGESSVLSWTTTNATNVALNQSNVTLNGSSQVSPSVTTTYNLTATGPGGSVTCSKTVTVKIPPPPAPTCTLTANPTSINQGQSAVLTWTSTNGTSATLNQGNVALSGSLQVSPSVTTTYTFTVTAGPIDNQSAPQTVTCTKTVTVIPVVNAPTCTLNVATAEYDNATTKLVALTWTTQNATNVSIAPGIGAVALNGTKSVTISQTTTFVLTASGPGGMVTCSKTVTVTPPPAAPTCTLTAHPTTINQGQNSTLSWTTQNASSVSINQGVGAVASNGSLQVSPGATKTYTLTAEGDGGTVVCTREIVVVTPPPAPTCTLTVAPQSITNGQSAVLSWTTTNATNVAIDNNIGAVALSGTKTVSPSVTTEYKLSAVGAGGSVLCKTVLAVNEPPKTPSCTLGSDKDYITAGDSVTLSWTSMNASQAFLNGGSVALSGSKLFTPASTTTYTLVVSTDSQSVTCTKTIKVKPYVPSAPVCTLSVNPSTIDKGDSATLVWSTGNATSVTIDQNIGTVTASGSKSVSPSKTTTYTLTATGEQGKTVTCVSSLTVEDEPEPEPLSCDGFTASPSTLSQAGTTTLTWNTSNATNVSINNGVGSVPVDGSKMVHVAANTLFTLTATDGEDTVTCQTQVTINPVVVVPKCDAFTASASQVNQGETVTLTWSTTNANNVSINNGVGAVAADGNVAVVVNGDTTYTLTASNGDASDSCQTTVTIRNGGGGGGGGGGSSSPRCTFTASDKKITAGEEVKLSWNNTRTNDIIIKDNRGNTIVNSKKDSKVNEDKGSVIVKPTRSTSYTLTVIRGSKDRDCTVDINVSDVSVSSIRSQVAGISLSSTPYTGFDAGPFLTTLFYSLLVLWGLGVAYVLVFKNGSILGVTRMTFASLKSVLPVAPITEHLVEQPRIPTYLVAPTVTTAPESVSLRDYTPVVGYENYTAEAVENAVVEEVVEEVTESEEVVNETDTFAALEERAHSARVLISSDALRFIGGQSALMNEQMAVLDRVITLAKATYPSENGWVIVNKEKVVSLLA